MAQSGFINEYVTVQEHAGETVCNEGLLILHILTNMLKWANKWKLKSFIISSAPSLRSVWFALPCIILQECSLCVSLWHFLFLCDRLQVCQAWHLRVLKKSLMSPHTIVGKKETQRQLEVYIFQCLKNIFHLLVILLFLFFFFFNFWQKTQPFLQTSVRVRYGQMVRF